MRTIMVLDIEMLRSFYASYAFKVEIAKKTINRPLTYAEKVLFTHLYDESILPPGQGRDAGRYGTDGSSAVYECR